MTSFIRSHFSSRGIALLVVLALVGLLALMAVAVLSVSESELKAARMSSDGMEAMQLAETAVNLVIAQLRKASAQNVDARGTETWVSQPGVLRRISSAGISKEAFKLYSSRHLLLRNPGGIEPLLLSDDPPLNWMQDSDRYVDLNSPVVRSDADGRPLLLFPILDPRAMSDRADSSIGGFSYSDRTLTGKPVKGVRMRGGDAQRLPMPVEWLYLLKDGSLGTLDEEGGFVGERPATAENPMVGRVAFWTDDESCKININTASEPTSWALPAFFHERDASFARYQPLNGEFQRYPGHPATTALSPVLFPGQTLTVAQKESIYELIPRVAPGGSVAGTRAYNDPAAAAVPLMAAKGERLFASVDELLLAENRRPNLLDGVALSAEALQKASFFLSAHSRSPEFNPFGLPKIAVWPVSYRGAEFRTAFDQLMVHCSTLRHADGDRPYLFQRGWADSSSQDIEQPHNAALLGYLKELLSRPAPGFAQDKRDTFAMKYGKDLPQILVEIFDYIRSTNLCDGNLVKESDKTVVSGMTLMLGYAPGAERRSDFKTFTDPRNYLTERNNANAENGIIEGDGYPGHGQTTPSRWRTEEVTVQGIGRFPTLSEVGLHFICCADNTADPDNPNEDRYSFLGKPGGGSAPRKAPINVNGITYDRWFSNFPPKPSPNPNEKKDKADPARYPFTGGYPYGADTGHPGYQKFNWNHQLEENRPLAPGFRRVQARMLLEFFVPSVGYTLLQPELTVRVEGLDGFRLNGKRLFPRSIELFWTGKGESPWKNHRQGGYGLGVTSLVGERFLPARRPMPADNGWGQDQWEIKPAILPPGDELCVVNYNLVSDFIDVEVGVNGDLPMGLSGEGGGEVPLTLELWSGHYGRAVSRLEVPANLVQTFDVKFPAASLKAPTLIRNTLPPASDLSLGTPDVEPVAYWTFYSKGALGFGVDALKKGTSHATADEARVMRGRFFDCNDEPRPKGSDEQVIGPGMPLKGAAFYGYDYPGAGVKCWFRPRTVSGASMAEVEMAEEREGCDVVQTVLIAHGDYRLTAALPEVPASAWRPHRFFGRRRLAHQFTRGVPHGQPGYDYASDADQDLQMIAGPVRFPADKTPDFPLGAVSSAAAQRYGDFDTGPPYSADGPFINKPDEGNVYVTYDGKGGLGYFLDGSRSVGRRFFSPNRMIPSPVMFGSLPTGVHENIPWRTLLFRPQKGHFGSGPRFGGSRPPDHLLLEYFWMPVVEPYAISGPFSTAGRVNLNYQMFPFTYIRRATAMHAVLTGVDISSVPAADAEVYKAFAGQGGSRERFWGTADDKVWHHDVDVEKTLVQFEERFAGGEVFISPSEICEIHLVPKSVQQSAEAGKMEQFWKVRRLTGDNVRERPYAGLYPRLTTRSNTFRVHYLAQTLKKPRSSPANKMTPDVRVTGEHQGSALIERHLDPARAGLPDFAIHAAGSNLDGFHDVRVLETRRFGF